MVEFHDSIRIGQSSALRNHKDHGHPDRMNRKKGRSEGPPRELKYQPSCTVQRSVNYPSPTTPTSLWGQQDQVLLLPQELRPYDRRMPNVKRQDREVNPSRPPLKIHRLKTRFRRPEERAVIEKRMNTKEGVDSTARPATET
ncbi:hypothetical protein CR513_30949, partial [Mucuna pruriens]